MRIVKAAFGAAVVMSLGLSLVAAQQAAPAPQAPAGGAAPGARGGGRGGAPAPGRGNQIVWSPKAIKPTGWVAPNRPWTKLSELLAKHANQTDWMEPIVRDELLQGDYVSMGPGKKTPKRMNADTREWWVVQDGQIRFTIDGQEPFVASKGWLVQVPYRNMYTMETVGDTPSLRFEVNVANATKMYPIEDTPVPVAGKTYVRARIANKGVYDDLNKPFFDFNDVVKGTARGGAFVTDPRGFANIISGNGTADPAPTNKGHFHEESGEFWFILWGKVRYKLEGMDQFIADQGDIVYAPKQMWHLASLAGSGMACRLAMNGYPDLAHSYDDGEPDRAGGPPAGRIQ